MPDPEEIDDGLWSLPKPMPGVLLSYTSVLSTREMRAMTTGTATQTDHRDRLIAWGAPPNVARHIPTSGTRARSGCSPRGGPGAWLPVGRTAVATP
jgi:hypothetical protein